MARSVGGGALPAFASALPFLALLQETTHNRFIFQKSHNIFGLHSEKVITFLDLEVFSLYLQQEKI